MLVGLDGSFFDKKTSSADHTTERKTRQKKVRGLRSAERFSTSCPSPDLVLLMIPKLLVKHSIITEGV